MSEAKDASARVLNKAEIKAIAAASDRLDEAQKTAVVRLFNRLLDVRGMEASAQEKLRAALPDEQDSKAALEALQSSASQIKDLAWDDRTWPARLGIGAATVVAASVAGQSAAMALLGTAIAIPLWVVFGSGDDFASALVAELEADLAEAAADRPILEPAEETTQPDEPDEIDVGEPQPEDRDITKLFYEIRDRGEEAISELRERGETFWQRINRDSRED